MGGGGGNMSKFYTWGEGEERLVSMQLCESLMYGFMLVQENLSTLKNSPSSG